MSAFHLMLLFFVAASGGTDVSDAVELALGKAPPAAQLFAVRVARGPGAQRDLFIKDDSLPAKIDIAFAFWVIREPQRIILIDTGFLTPKVKGWRIEAHRSPLQSLRQLGIEADQVTDVVLTHDHWDHVGGLAHYDTARLWLTEATLRGLQRRAGKGNKRLGEFLRKADNNGRLHRVTAPQRVTPYLTAVPVGLHTPGFLYLVLERVDGPWVIASDIGPLRANFERLLPSGQTSDPKSTTATIRAIMEIVDGDLRRIVPGHEPTLFDIEEVVELKSVPPGVE